MNRVESGVADPLSAHWLQWWMAQCPNCQGFSYLVWMLLGLVIQAAFKKAHDLACQGKNCGNDGYGGSCGNCDGYDKCVDGLCEACTPQCSTLAIPGTSPCGSDGCGGSCGPCEGGNFHCIHELGLCFCTPDCAGKSCGDDGCKGSCGYCTGAQEECVEGQCECVPDCAGMNCGDDGCGGSCGVCTEPQATCVDGSCVCPYGNDTQLCNSCLPFSRWSSYSELIEQLDLYQLVDMAPDHIARLRTAIIELECGQVVHWSDYDNLDPLTYEQVVEVWVRRIAVCLRNEIDHVFGYSILSYSELDRRRLLTNPIKPPTGRGSDTGIWDIDKYPIQYVDILASDVITKDFIEWEGAGKYASDFYLSANNPLAVFSTAMAMLQNDCPDCSPDSVIYKLMDTLSDEGYKHVGQSNPDSASTFLGLVGCKVYLGCQQFAGFLWHIARACNVPALVGNLLTASTGEVISSGHGYIRFTDLAVFISGDDISSGTLPGSMKVTSVNWFMVHSNGSTCEYWYEWERLRFNNRYVVWWGHWPIWGELFESELFDLLNIGPSGKDSTSFALELLYPAQGCLCSIGSVCGCENPGIGFDANVRYQLKGAFKILGLPEDLWENILNMYCDGTFDGCLHSDYFMTSEAWDKTAACAISSEVCCPAGEEFCDTSSCPEWSMPVCRKKWCDGTL